jgi:hypothetical protein
MATVAVFVALGGTSYAVATGSIDSRELKNDSVRSKDIRDNDVRSRDVRNGSLLARDFTAGQLPSGPRGPAGPQGAPGPASAATNAVVRFVEEAVPANTPDTGTFASASCNAGERLIGGGAAVIGAAFNDVSFSRSGYGFDITQGSPPTEWIAGVVNPSADTGTLRAWATCVSP